MVRVPCKSHTTCWHNECVGDLLSAMVLSTPHAVMVLTILNSATLTQAVHYECVRVPSIQLSATHVLYIHHAHSQLTTHGSITIIAQASCYLSEHASHESTNV